MAGIVLGAEEISAIARGVGFSPDQAVTMTAIALAESGGNTGSNNTSGEDSRGLWQINHAGFGNPPPDWLQSLDLFDPRDNAVAAWRISQEGGHIGPWSVTHADRGSPFREYADEARAAAAHYGETADGNFDNPPANRRSPAVPAGDPGDIPFSGEAPGSVDPAVAPPQDEPGPSQVDVFVEAALRQEGDTYIFSANTDPDDPDPDAFDCSELVEWAAEQAGIPNIGEATYIQYNNMKDAGTTISVEEALKTRGALLFRFPGGEPEPGQNFRKDGYHVAISLGDGRTIEARGTKDDVGVFDGAADRDFTHAARVAGMDYQASPDSLLTPPEPAVPAPPAPLDVAAMNANSVDTDVDMLPDHFEVRYGLNPSEADTEGDGITDGYELIVLGTDPGLADTDFDAIADGLEVSLGLNPLVADNPDLNAPLEAPAELLLDTDGDGLTDWGEELAGTNPNDPDSDDDVTLDGDELMLDTDPLTADS